MPLFTKKHYYLGPLEFFENENFDANAKVHAEILDLELYLTFGYLTCSERLKKFFHTPPY